MASKKRGEKGKKEGKRLAGHVAVVASSCSSNLI